MITENNVTLLAPCSKIGNSAAALCATSENAVAANGQVSVFQQLMKLIPGSGHDTLFDQQGEISEASIEGEEIPEEFIDEMPLHFLSGLEAIAANMHMVLPTQLESSNVQNFGEASLEASEIVGVDLIQVDLFQIENQTTMHEGAAHVSKDASVAESGLQAKPVAIEGFLENIQEKTLENSSAETLENSAIVSEAIGDSRAGKTRDHNAPVIKNLQQSSPIIAKEPGASHAEKTLVTNVPFVESLQEESAVVTAEVNGSQTITTKGTEENKTERLEQWTGDVALSHQTEMSGQAAEIEKPELCTQIKEEILNKLEQKGPSEFKLRLEPEELGEIDIKMKLSNGKLIINIESVNPKTQTLLASQVDKLLLSMGLPNAQVEILQSSAQGYAGPNSQNQSYTGHAGMDFSQREQRDSLQKQWKSNQSRIAAANVLQQESAMARSGFIPGQTSNPNKMDYII